MNVVAFDTETKGFDWWAGETAFIATTADARDSWCFDLSDETARNKFKSQLKTADVIVAHNLSFDVHQVFATIGFDILECRAELHDTDLMARVAWPENTWGEHGGFKLDKLTEHFLGRDGKAGKEAIKEAAREMGINLNTTPQAYYKVWLEHPSLMEKYAMLDARDTWDLYAKLDDTFNDIAHSEADRTQYEIYQTEAKVAPILIRAERRGTRVDPEAVKRLRKDYLKREKRLHASLTTQLGPLALGGEGSEAALVEALQKQGVPLHRRTDSGDSLSTAKFALQEFANEYPIVEEFLEYRTVEKFLSTYIGPLSDTEVVHPSIRQIGAWTGRMSCMRPNMQNIPVRAGSEVRECYVPREGYKLIVSDFEQIEARVVAYYLGPEGQAWRDLINAGEDVHAHMACDLANRGVKPWSEAPRPQRPNRSPGARFTPEDFDKHGPNGKLRSAARHTLFAILYGAGGCRVCDQLGLPTGPPLTEHDWVVQRGYKEVGQPSCKQGQEIAKAVKGNIPGYPAFARKVRRKVEAEGFVTTMLGRLQRILRTKGYVGIAALAQGTAADVMKEAIVLADAALARHDAHILMIVHDEILAEAPIDKADAALAALRVAMESAVECDPPFLTSGVVADNYGEAK